MSFVIVKVVQSAVTKLVTMFNPAGAVIQAIITIYNTIMFFVERMRQIIQVVTAFIDSIAAIASGAVQAAADRVERTLGGLLTLAISFLARLVGLGKVSDAVTNIINKIRAPIDRALDKVVEWIVEKAKKLAQVRQSKRKDVDSVRKRAKRCKSLHYIFSFISSLVGGLRLSFCSRMARCCSGFETQRSLISVPVRV